MSAACGKESDAATLRRFSDSKTHRGLASWGRREGLRLWCEVFAGFGLVGGGGRNKVQQQVPQHLSIQAGPLKVGFWWQPAGICVWRICKDCGLDLFLEALSERVPGTAVADAALAGWGSLQSGPPENSVPV